MMDTAAAIKDAVTCRQFADHVGLKVNRAGFAVCPFHGDKDASLKIYKGDRGWCCFGCHRGGDVINLASLYYGLGFKETLQRLNDDFGLGIIQDSQETGLNGVLRAVEVSRRKTARQKEERLRRALECEFWAAFDKWLSADRRVLDSEQSARDGFTEEFCAALKDREQCRERLINVEMRRVTYEP